MDLHAPEAGAAFDRLTRLAAKILRTPVSLVTMVEAERQVILGQTGLGEPWASRGEMPLEYSYCQHALGSTEPLLIHDARVDARVRNSPAIAENRSIAYAGVPLRTVDGHAVGTLCVVDTRPRAWTEEEQQVLRDLAAGAMTEIRLRRDIARREHMLATLQRQASLLDLAHDMILVRDMDDRVVQWNRGAERAYGWSRAEAIGSNVHDLLRTEYPRPAEEIRRELWQTGRWEGDLVHTTRAGARIIVASRWALQRNEAGKPIAVLEINRDITQRRRAELALRDANAHLEGLVQARTSRLQEAQRIAKLGHWEMDHAVEEAFWSEEVYRIFGRSPASFSPSKASFLQCVHRDDRAWVADLLMEAREQEAGFEFEHRIVRPSGEKRIVHQRVEIVRDAGGRPLRLVGTTQDVTDQRAAEMAVEASERRFRALIERSQELISIVGADGTIRYESPAVERVLGYRPEELIDRNLLALVHGEDAERVAQAIGRVADTMDPATLEYRCRHKDGSYRVLEAVATNLLAEPAVAGIVVNSRDVTQMRLAEERLRQAQKMEAIGRLSGGIAHDFNNVLSVIKGRASIAMMDLPEDSDTYQDVLEIDHAVDRAANLTRQLLAFARQQVLQPEILDLNAIIADLEKMLRRTLGEDIEFVTVLDPRLGMVEADPGQIEQILMNLAVNARDAMPTGGKLITETRNVDLTESYAEQFGYEVVPGHYVMLSVSDTGTGMSREVRERIFEPFFTTKEPGKGTGMGLSTVYGIVKQSGGYVWVYSEEGRGTTLKIYLPRVDEEAPAEEPQAPAPERQRTATILLVEDEPAVRSTACRMLERMGHVVLEAGNGEEALRVAEEHAGEIDLLLTDVVMPLMGGRELVERLHQARPDLRVIYTSGYTDEAVIRHGVLEGNVAFLQKPYQPVALAAKIQDVLRSADGER